MNSKNLITKGTNSRFHLQPRHVKVNFPTLLVDMIKNWIWLCPWMSERHAVVGQVPVVTRNQNVIGLTIASGYKDQYQD